MFQRLINGQSCKIDRWEFFDSSEFKSAKEEKTSFLKTCEQAHSNFLMRKSRNWMYSNVSLNLAFLLGSFFGTWNSERKCSYVVQQTLPWAHCESILISFGCGITYSGIIISTAEVFPCSIFLNFTILFDSSRNSQRTIVNYPILSHSSLLAF